MATEISNGSHETSHHNNPFEVENENSNPFQEDMEMEGEMETTISAELTKIKILQK